MRSIWHRWPLYEILPPCLLWDYLTFWPPWAISTCTLWGSYTHAKICLDPPLSLVMAAYLDLRLDKPSGGSYSNISKLLVSAAIALSPFPPSGLCFQWGQGFDVCRSCIVPTMGMLQHLQHPSWTLPFLTLKQNPFHGLHMTFWRSLAWTGMWLFCLVSLWLIGQCITFYLLSLFPRLTCVFIHTVLVQAWYPKKSISTQLCLNIYLSEKLA